MIERGPTFSVINRCPICSIYNVVSFLQPMQKQEGVEFENDKHEIYFQSYFHVCPTCGFTGLFKK